MEQSITKTKCTKTISYVYLITCILYQWALWSNTSTATHQVCNTWSLCADKAHPVVHCLHKSTIFTKVENKGRNFRGTICLPAQSACTPRSVEWYVSIVTARFSDLHAPSTTACVNTSRPLIWQMNVHILGMVKKVMEYIRYDRVCTTDVG